MSAVTDLELVRLLVGAVDSLYECQPSFLTA